MSVKFPTGSSGLTTDSDAARHVKGRHHAKPHANELPFSEGSASVATASTLAESHGDLQKIDKSDGKWGFLGLFGNKGSAAVSTAGAPAAPEPSPSSRAGRAAALTGTERSHEMADAVPEGLFTLHALLNDPGEIARIKAESLLVRNDDDFIMHDLPDRAFMRGFPGLGDHLDDVPGSGRKS